VFDLTRELFQRLRQADGHKIIAVEGPSYGSRFRAEPLARVRQCVHDMAAFYFEDFLWYEIPPPSAKLAVTGNGSAKKEVVAEHAHNLCGGELEDYEKHGFSIGDAASVAWASRIRYLTSVEKEVRRAAKARP
jgi:hypothetical protein